MIISFPIFLSIWNKSQNLNTPDVHFRIAEWLEDRFHAGDRQMLLMAFRACGKSTLVGLFCAWVLNCKPNSRIMVLAADFTLARKMVRNVRNIIEKHPLTRHMKPQNASQWAGDRFTVKRSKELRDPSMMAKGITSNITGSRADMIICDDVEVPNTSETAEKRAELRERLAETDYILVPGGQQLYVGTPHHYYTIYAREPRMDIGEEQAFLHNAKRLEIPLVNADGSSAWPARYPREEIERMRKTTGPQKFASQMQLQPTNIADGRLDTSLLQYYDADLEYKQTQGRAQLWLRDTQMVSVSAWWDPAFGTKSNDHSVLAIIFADNEGRYYLHHLNYIRIKNESQEDEATQQCRMIIDSLRQYMVGAVHIETNGIGKFLPGIMRRTLGETGYGCAIIEEHSSRAKDVRILEAFDALLAAQSLYVHKSVTRTPFTEEMREWKPGRNNGHDDGIDAVAGALACEPVRVGTRINASGPRPNWQGGHTTYTAQTD